MPTFEVDDQLHSHPKTDRAGLEAMGLWVVAGSWCSGYLTDGFVPRGRAEKLGPLYLWDRLVDAGFVERRGDDFQFHDWDHWNRTSTSILAKRVKATEKKQDQRAAKRATSKVKTGGITTCPPGTHEGTTKETDAGTREGSPHTCPQGSPGLPRARDLPCPIPCQISEEEIPPTPFLEKGDGSKKGAKRSARVTIPDGWEPSESHYRRADKLGGFLPSWVQGRAEEMRAWAKQNNKRYSNWDAVFNARIDSVGERDLQAGSGGKLCYMQPAKIPPEPDEPIEEIARLAKENYDQFVAALDAEDSKHGD